jgi:hypothetical protein
MSRGWVKEVHLTPRSATVTVFKRDENGNKHLIASNPYLPGEGDDITGFSSEVATEVIEHEVIV